MSAGYRFLGRRVELLLIPVLLDMVLWFAPRLTLSPIFEQIANFYLSTPETTAMVSEAAQLTPAQLQETFRLAGAESNLWSGLVSANLMHVPSLLAGANPTTGMGVIPIDNSLLALGIYLLLAVAGIFIGVVYLMLLARNLPLGKAGQAVRQLKPATVLRNFGRVLGFALIVIMLLGAILLPLTLMAGLLTLVAPAAGNVAAIFIGAIPILVFLYLAFVTIAMVVDDMGIWAAVKHSAGMIRFHLFSTLGILVLTGFIGLGLSLLLFQLAATGPAGAAVAILAQAYVGTGLTMALMVFYRTRQLGTQSTNPPIVGR